MDTEPATTTQPGQIPPGARPLGGGAHLMIPLRPDIDRARGRHPSMRAVPPIPTRPVVPAPRTLPDEDIERGARIVGMRDGSPRHRKPGRLTRLVEAVLGVTR